MIFSILITFTTIISAKPTMLSTSDMLAQLQDEVQFAINNPTVPIADALPSLNLLHPAVEAQLAYVADAVVDKYQDVDAIDVNSEVDFYGTENSATYFSKFIDEASDAAIAEVMDRMQANIEGIIDIKFSDLVNMSEEETAQTLFSSLDRFE